MKTAISVPDELHSRVTKKAHELGMSRSELFARAAECYLDELDDPAVTGLIDDVLARVDEAQDANLAAAGAGRRLLAEQGDW
ncbi:MAG: ribbon-helix-helix protein, CopG family [Actinobacteria bacterium]|nr:ribbon-helix-helix protein, CopG family [Actinomycetota bacterium]